MLESARGLSKAAGHFYKAFQVPTSEETMDHEAGSWSVLVPMALKMTARGVCPAV